MADDVLASFLVALGFKVDTASQASAKKSVADYEKAVREAEKRIEDARWAGAQTEAEVAKLARETNLKLAREALDRAKETEKKEKEVADKRKERAKEFAAGLERMALAAAAAATAIEYAVGKIAGSFDNLYFQAQRSGTSVQSLKALQYAFSQTGGTAQQASSAVDSFTTALRNNPGLRKFVGDLGVSDKLQGVDKLLATVEALNKEPYEVAVQHAEMLGISEETYNLLKRQMAAVKEYRAEYDATAKRVGLNSDEAARAATMFQRTLTQLQATASALADKLLIQLAPALEKVVKGFLDWIESNPEKIDHILKGISDAIVWFTEKLTALVEWFGGDGGEAFIKRWDELSSRIKAIGTTFDYVWGKFKDIDTWLADSKIYQFFKWYAGGGVMTFSPAGAIYDKMTGQGASAPSGADNRTFLERHLPRILGGKDAPSAGPVMSGPAPAGSDAGNLTKLIEQEARRAGIDPRIMQGIRAGESGHRQNGSNPNRAYDKKDDALESSWGPFQLNRRRGLGAQFERETGLDVRDPRTIAAQTRWVAEGLKKHGRRWLSNWMGYHGDRDADPRWGDSGYVPTPPATAPPRPTTPPPALPSHSVPNSTPGGFDPNNINPTNLTPSAPLGANSVTNNSSNRAVNQVINNNVKIEGSNSPREHGRIMESSLSRVHGLALANAQTAVI